MKPAFLYKKENSKVHCLACCHKCLIPNGKRGICGVRENVHGELQLLVHSKVVAKHIDPIEKKPLYHFLPGSKIYSLGTVGCNFHCGFCFLPDTYIINKNSMTTLEELFHSATEYERLDSGEVGFLTNSKVITHTSELKAVTKVFKQVYEGEIIQIQSRHAPTINCTPEHKVFVYKGRKIVKIKAKYLKKGDLLCVPKFITKEESGNCFIDVKKILSKEKSFIKIKRKLNEVELKKLLELKKQGKTSRELGKIWGMHPVYIRKLLGILKVKGIDKTLFKYENRIVEKNKKVKFNTEKNEGIPRFIALDKDFAELLGYYCAEGHVSKYIKRPNSFRAIFSYGHHEQELVKRTKELINKIFDVNATEQKRRTTITVECGKSSLAVLLKEICGKCSKEKKIPNQIIYSSRININSFMKAFLKGDGCVLKDNIAFNTVSKRLAFGIYFLLLQLGYLPSFYEWNPPPKKIIEGRTVNQSTLYYVKLKAEKFREHFLGNFNYELKKKSENHLQFKETASYWLVPIFKIAKTKYKGNVYNCEVENDHSYLANFISVANCQNYSISQEKEIAGEDLPPEKIKEEAGSLPSIAYTYNEPTIFFEYAYDIAKLLKNKKHIFVSNGYFSEETLTKMSFVDGINIDLKSFNDEFYKKNCGAKLQPVLDNIKKCHEKGIWVELTTLLIPGENNSEEELRKITRFIASVDKEIPWHISAFHPDYKMLDKKSTSFQELLKAYNIAKEEGLSYVYLGNISNIEHNSTYCPKCKKILIRRENYNISVEGLDKEKCKYCGYKIKGVWK